MLNDTILILIFALLGIAIAILSFLVGKKTGKTLANARWKQQLPKIRKQATQQSRAVIGGQVSEQVAPFLPGFPYSSTDVKFIGQPIDFVVFKGLSNKKIEEIAFVEVKSGNATLSPIQKEIKKALEKNKVKFVKYNAPKK